MMRNRPPVSNQFDVQIDLADESGRYTDLLAFDMLRVDKARYLLVADQFAEKLRSFLATRIRRISNQPLLFQFWRIDGTIEIDFGSVSSGPHSLDRK